jgi:hypothetical protein
MLPVGIKLAPLFGRQRRLALFRGEWVGRNEGQNPLSNRGHEVRGFDPRRDPDLVP